MELKNLKPDLYIKNIISIPLDFFKSNNKTRGESFLSTCWNIVFFIIFFY